MGLLPKEKHQIPSGAWYRTCSIESPAGELHRADPPTLYAYHGPLLYEIEKGLGANLCESGPPQILNQEGYDPAGNLPSIGPPTEASHKGWASKARLVEHH